MHQVFAITAYVATN